MLELNTEGHIASVGYVFSPTFQGRGFATEALDQIIRVALSEPTIWRISATTDTENTASMRVMEKAGMAREGLLRRYAIRPQIGDEPRDAFIFSAIR